MKKLFLFTALFILVSGVFAEPKIPKISNYLDSEKIDYTGSYYLSFISNYGTNIYKVFAETDKNKFVLWFKNKSIITGVEIILCMNFPDEQELDEVISDIDTTNLENEFVTLRRSIISYNINPIIETDKNNNPVKITYFVASY
ncbi:MAG: hypothetical protein J6T31_05425 [Methanobrevibacter sp.]|nr:hypothetical protein [Methanobrevibacter sp.]